MVAVVLLISLSFSLSLNIDVFILLQAGIYNRKYNHKVIRARPSCRSRLYMTLSPPFGITWLEMIRAFEI